MAVVKTIRSIDVSDVIHNVDEEYDPSEFIAETFARKQVSVIASKAGVGKTWFLLALARDLSRGGTIMDGLSFLEPTRKTLYLIGDTGINIVLERFNNLYPRADKNNVCLVSGIETAKMGAIIDFDSKEGVAICDKLMEETRPDLLIVDTLMSFRYGDENSNKETALTIQRLKYIAEKHNCAVLVAHHLRKKSKSEKAIENDQDEIIGGSSLVRFSSAAFILEKHGSVHTLRCVKSWWDTRERFSYTMETTTDGITFKQCSNNESMKRIDIMNYIVKRGGVFSVNDIVTETKGGETTVRNAIKALNCTIAAGNGGVKKYCLTPTKSTV